MSATSNADVHLEVIKPEDLDLITPIAIDEYCLSEPVTLGFHATPDDMREFLMPGVVDWVASGLSIMARDKRNGDAVAGVMLCKISTADNALTYGSLPAANKKSGYYKKITEHVESAYNPFKDGVTKVLEQALLAVHPDYRGRGLGSMMAKKCDELGASAGCQLGMVSASNIATYKIFHKLAYTTVYTLDYSDYEVEEGVKVDISVGNGTNSLVVMIKKL